MNNPLISIIVPIYNVEKYLEKCVLSIRNQSYLNLEIILVDDGSFDGCPAKCDSYAQIDSRIKVIHKKNGGLSSARNAGLDIATGYYVGFVDSDDYIHPQMYEKLLAGFSYSDSIGLVKCLIFRDTGIGIRPYGHWNFDAETIVLATDYAKFAISDKFCNSVCDMLFNASLLKNVRFAEGRKNEDFLFHLELSSIIENNEKKLLLLPDRLYYYRLVENSICNQTLSPLSINTINNIRELLSDESIRSRGLNSILDAKLTSNLYWLNMQMLSNKALKIQFWKEYHTDILSIRFSSVADIWGIRHLVGLILLKYGYLLLRVDKVRNFCNKCGEIPPCMK